MYGRWDGQHIGFGGETGQFCNLIPTRLTWEEGTLIKKFSPTD